MLELSSCWKGKVMAICKHQKDLTAILLSSILLLSACQTTESTQVQIDPALTKAVKEPDITYGVIDNSIYEKPKIVKYNPYTGDKKTIFEAPKAPPELYKPATNQDVEASLENLPVPTLPKAEFKQRLSARLADLLGEKRAFMFDAQVSSLNKQERQAVSKLRMLINAPLAKNQNVLPVFNSASDISTTLIAERCFYEASNALKEKEIKVEIINKIAEKYWQVAPNWLETNSAFISYDANKHVFKLKNATAWEQVRYLGSDLIDISVKASGDTYYVNAHEVNYLSFNDLLSDNEQKSILRDAGLITCGDWLIGYYDNRFESSHIKNGGIIFADYYWLDSFDYELKLLSGTDDYYIASKNMAFGSKDNKNYKPRLCQPVSSKHLSFQKAKLDLKTREHYLAAALPKRPQFNEQVIAKYNNTDDILYLNLPFNDYALAFSLARKEAKRPAFIALNKLLSKQTQTK